MRLGLLCVCLLGAVSTAIGDCPKLESLVDSLPQASIFSEILAAAAQDVPTKQGTARRLLEDVPAGEAPHFRACPRIFSPVCSTDGQQYSNDCMAANRGAQVACRGSCPCGVEASAAFRPEPVDPVNGPCPKIYSPVCGTDGLTYTSKCVAGGADAVECEGFCPCTAGSKRELLAADGGMVMPCPAIYAPVCGVDNTTYGSDCMAKGAGAEVACDGECPCAKPDAKPCPLNYMPVCGVDNTTYGNECAAGDMKVECVGECPCSKAPIKPCPKNYMPVCGVDGATYSNECMAGDVKVDCQGECPCKDSGSDVQQSNGDDAVCMAIVEPVCGADGKTYTNGCLARVAGAAIECSGECPCTDALKALEASGGIVLVPSDDAMLEALNATDAAGDLLANTAMLKQILARHIILPGPDGKVPVPSQDGTVVLTQAGQRVQLFSDDKGRLVSVGTGPDGDKVSVLGVKKGCKLAVYEISAALEGTGSTSP